MRIAHFAALAGIVVLAGCSSDAGFLPNGGGINGGGPGGGNGGPGSGNPSGVTSQGLGGPPGSEEELANSVGDRVLFQYDQSQLSPEASATLDRQAAWLAQYPANNVQIAGNCDERGTEEYNLVLGNRRANAVVDYLRLHGVAQTRLTAISFGKDRPTAAGSDEQSWAQNRNAITSLR